MRIGILGGTLDPIHYAHLFVAEDARVQFHLDRVLFIPNGTPPHKPAYAVTDARHRLAMTALAVENNPRFVCSDIEIRRDGPSYSIDTLLAVKEDNPGAELFFLTGIDAVAEITSWHRHEDVMQSCTFIAATRPGFSPEELTERLPAAYAEKVLLLAIPPLAISSTDIRRRVAQGLPVRYLTPDPVADYIREHGLYRE